MAGKKIGKAARPARSRQPKEEPTREQALSIARDAVWSALRSPLRVRLLEAICATPGIEARALAEALDSTAPRVHYHLNILVRAGLITPAGPDAPEGEKANARGHSATGFRAVFRMIPQECFAGTAEAESRALRLLREVAEEGIASMSPRGKPRNGLARFGHEALSANELDEVVLHLTRVREILDRARSRRHQRGGVSRASAFVGFCVGAVVDPRLPDGPLGWDEPLHPGSVEAGGRRAGRKPPEPNV